VFTALAWPWLAAATHSTSAGNHPNDARLHVWIFAWVYRALTSFPERLFDAPMFFPAPGQLTGSEHFLSSQLAFAPIYAATGNALLAVNLLTWLSYPLAAFAMERLLRALGLSAAAAWPAGLLFALGPLRVPASLQVPQLLNLYFPLIALALLRLRERPDAAGCAAVAAVLGLAAFSSYYLAAMAAAVAAVWGTLELTRGGAHRGAFAARAAVAGVVVLCLVAAFSRPYFERAQPTPLDQARFQALAPSPTPRTDAPPAIPWDAVAPLLWPPGDRLGPALAVLGLAGFAVPGLRRVAAAGVAFVAIGVGVMLWLVVAGGMSTGVASLLGFFRHAYRSQLLTGFGVALLAAAALEAMRRGLGARAGAAAAALVVALVVAGPGRALVTPELDRVALSDEEVRAYAEVARRTAQDPGPLLELPVVGATGADLRLRALLGSLEHRMPLVNGFSGHLPPHFLIISSRTARLPDPAAVSDLVRATHLRWLLLRPPHDWKDPGERERQRTRLLELPGAVATDLGGFTLLRIDLPHDREAWFDAIAAGRGLAELPEADRRHLEPWAFPPAEPSAEPGAG
jgi:hypothetical protein